MKTSDREGRIVSIDPHVHSRYSPDTLAKPERIIKVAQKRGLQAVAITDHSTIKGGVRTALMAKNCGITVVIGAEMLTDAGDIIGLFLNEELQSNGALELVDEIRDQGGLSVLPHPFRGHKLNEEILSRIDMIEVFNSKSTIGQNKAAVELARRLKKPGIAGSDAHFCSEIGIARTLLESDDIQRALTKQNLKLETEYSPSYKTNVSQSILFLRNRQFDKMFLSLGESILELMR